MHRTLGFLGLLSLLFSSCDKEPMVSDNMEETFYVRNEGSDMPAFVRGNGASKVFIIYLQGGPGFGALAAEGFPFGNDLEKEYAMVYWDQRHTGNAHGHFDKEDLTLKTVVKDLSVLVKTIKKRYGNESSIFLMGASWGGRLALSYLLEENYQEEIKGWISVAGVNTTSRFDDQNQWVISLAGEEITAGKNLETWNEILEFFDQLKTEEKLSLEEKSKRNGYLNQISRELISDYINEGSLLSRALSHANDAVSNKFNFNAMPKEFRDEVNLVFYDDEQLNKITSPALLIYGKYDFIVPAKQGQYIYEHISSQNKDYHLYLKSGHSPMFTESDLFVSHVSTFIDSHK